ncbi:MAG: hypothetical protein U0X39_01440 [Bacteroidales bacterium]
MENKKYVQWGTFSIAVLSPIFLFCLVMLILSGFSDKLEVAILSFVILTFAICLLIFYKITILITDTHFIFSMGIGLVRKKIPLSEIEGCLPVRNPVFWGIGIRLTPSGWLYNVSGLKAVELSFRNKNSKIRVGINVPEDVAREVNQRINASPVYSDLADKGKRSYNFLWILLILPLFIVIALVSYGGGEIETELVGSSVRVNGMYGVQINYSDIITADTITSLPGIKARTNGYASSRYLKGHFKLDDGTRARLFIRKGSVPCILIKTSTETIILNLETPQQTRELYSIILSHTR